MFGNYVVSLKEGFRIMFGDFATDNYDTTEWIFFACAVIMVTLLMMNMLIAIVSETFTTVRENEEKNSNLQLLDMVLELETFISYIPTPREYQDDETRHLVFAEEAREPEALSNSN